MIVVCSSSLQSIDFRFSFYLLSPATSYAGEYIWQGDSKSGCEKILKDTGIAKEEWQMGVTKAFIKNPETVRTVSSISTHRCIYRLCSYLRWRRCAIVIGTTWLHVSNVHSGITCGTRMNVLNGFKGSGRTTRNRSFTRKLGIMDTRFLQAGKNVADSGF